METLINILKLISIVPMAIIGAILMILGLMLSLLATGFDFITELIVFVSDDMLEYSKKTLNKITNK